jgi:hypothetical protein
LLQGIGGGRESSHGGGGSALEETEVENDAGGGCCNSRQGRHHLFQSEVGVAESVRIGGRGIGAQWTLTRRRGHNGMQQTPNRQF